jgi:hypothetical protein
MGWDRTTSRIVAFIGANKILTLVLAVLGLAAMYLYTYRAETETGHHNQIIKDNSGMAIQNN